MVGGDEFEKIGNGKAKIKETVSRKKGNRPKRGGVREIPHASDESVPFEAPPEETSGVGGEEEMSAESFKEKYGAWLDKDLFSKDGDSIRIVSKYYDAATGKVGAWFNSKDQKPERRAIAIKELDQYFENFKSRETIRKKVSPKASVDAGTGKAGPFNGQFLEDEAEFGSKTFLPGAYHNGSIPHDADEAMKERPVNVESSSEQELDSEDLNDVVEDIEKQWNVIMGVHQDISDEEDRILILKGTISDYGKKQLENILGASKEQAKRIVGEIIDKILTK